MNFHAKTYVLFGALCAVMLLGVILYEMGR